MNTRRAVRGVGVNIFNILEDARHKIGLLQYNLFKDIIIVTLQYRNVYNSLLRAGKKLYFERELGKNVANLKKLGN